MSGSNTGKGPRDENSSVELYRPSKALCGGGNNPLVAKPQEAAISSNRKTRDSDLTGVGVWTEGHIVTRSSGQQGQQEQSMGKESQGTIVFPKLKRNHPLDRYVDASMKEDPWTGCGRG